MKTTAIWVALGSIAVSTFALSDAQALQRKHAHGHSVRVQTRKANANAGTAKAIAPDSKQSATGGQPGGLPGH